MEAARYTAFHFIDPGVGLTGIFLAVPIQVAQSHRKSSPEEPAWR
jgi:hypothetical protein